MIDHKASLCAMSPALPVPVSYPTAPIFLENYLWTKGVPVLTAAVTGERAQFISAAGVAAAAGSGFEECNGDDQGWRAVHGREMYRILVKPALEDAFRKGKELPEPVSIDVTR